MCRQLRVARVVCQVWVMARSLWFPVPQDGLRSTLRLLMLLGELRKPSIAGGPL